MDETELLRTIRPIWLHRTTLSLARGMGLREDLRAELERFFDLLERAIDTGDPAWLDPILTDWATALTQTDLDGEQSSTVEFIREIMVLTNQICRETLESEPALDLIAALVPAFGHAFEKTAREETRLRVEHISSQLEQAQHTLERLERSKSDFIAVAAHELKTPLTLVEGYTAMLRESCENSGPPAVELDLMNGINSGARRLKNIIDDMIDVSLIDNNLLQLNFQPVWLDRILQILKNELEVAAKERRQQVNLVDFPGASEMIFGDPERLMQVFRNVLTNAIKFTPDGGSVTVEGRKLSSFIEIIIHDTGIGIDPEDQSIIFDKFTRLGNISLHSSGKTKFKGGGPGLGLHIARGIIEAHGGAIWVESPGYDEKNLPGSTFHIMLPQRSEPPDTSMAKLLSPLLHTENTFEEKAQ